MEIQEFSPAKAEIQAALLEVEGLTIAGVEDEAGYEAVKVGRKRLGDMRNKITKFGKGQREEAIRWQKEVLRQEKELVALIEPVESKLKAELERIDEEKKRKEREILLPIRKTMLAEIELELTDDEIVGYDEKEFAIFFQERKMQYLEAKERARKEEEDRKKREEELEQARKEAAENAKKEAEEKAERDKILAAEKAEKDKQDAIDKIKRDQEEKERKEKQAREQAIKDEEARLENERKEQERNEKNRKYKAWLRENGVEQGMGDQKIYCVQLADEQNVIVRDENSFTLYKKVSSITI